MFVGRKTWSRKVPTFFGTNITHLPVIGERVLLWPHLLGSGPHLREHSRESDSEREGDNTQTTWGGN